MQVLVELSKVDHWHFDTFRLNDVTNGWPLSTLAFALMQQSGLMPGRWVRDALRGCRGSAMILLLLMLRRLAVCLLIVRPKVRHRLETILYPTFS